jgi:4-amino-4-deoxy-L-arabinose transferase-like glycosyltransferase
MLTGIHLLANIRQNVSTLRAQDLVMPSEKQLWYLTLVMLLIGFLLHLGMQPLYLEEPRRAMITMEMLDRGNWFLPTELGDFYYNKPPFFNWVLMLSASLFGGLTEWAVRLPTVLSVLLTMWMMFRLGKRYVGHDFAWISPLLLATNGSVLLFFSYLGEIDLFYAMVSFSAFAALFHFRDSGRYLLMFVLFYGFHAMGMLTKGLPSIVFILLSLPAWLWYKKELKALFSWAHLAGIGLFSAIVGGYLLMYHQFNNVWLLLPAWFGQAGERTIAEQGWTSLLAHLLIFPLDTLKDLLPISLLLPLAWSRNVRQRLQKNDWLMFSLIMIAVNYPVYWISPGARQRYLYMLYPLFANIFAFLWLYSDKRTYFRWIMLAVLPILALGSLLLPFFGIGLPVALLMALCLGLTAFYLIKQAGSALTVMVLTMALLRIAFDWVVIPERATNSQAQEDRELAGRIHDITGTAPLAIYRYDRISFTTVYYLNRLRGQILKRDYSPSSGHYYLAEADCVERPHEILLRFEYQQKPYLLFRLSE